MPSFLPKVENCCFSVELKIGVIIISILAILGSLGLGAVAGGGPCIGSSKKSSESIQDSMMPKFKFGSVEESINTIVAVTLYFVAVIILICGILMLVNIICNVDAVKIAFTIFAWAAFIGGCAIIIGAIIQVINSWRICETRTLGYLLWQTIYGLWYIYCACVVNSFGGGGD